MTIARSKVAIVIPVHDEEAYLPTCLAAACTAADAAKSEQDVFVVVVLDRCSDRSESIARSFPVHAVCANAGSVGAARSIGANTALSFGATWLAFTDADTVVAQDWIVAQRSLKADAVCGTVAVSDWHLHDPQVRIAYETHYSDCDGHRHIHGANLGISSVAYLACGGFENIPLDEDVNLVQRLLDANFSVAWTALPRVATSARTANRVIGGFGGRIETLARKALAENAPEETLIA